MLGHQLFGTHAAGVPQQGAVRLGHIRFSRPLAAHQLLINPEAEQIAKQIGVVVKAQARDGKVRLGRPEHGVIAAQAPLIPAAPGLVGHRLELPGRHIALLACGHQGALEVEAGRDIDQEGGGTIGLGPGDGQLLLRALRLLKQGAAHQGLGKDGGSFGQRHGVAALAHGQIADEPVVPGVAELVGEGDDVIHGAGVGDKDPRLHRFGKLGTVGPGAPVWGGCGINPSLLRHHAGKVPHLGIEAGERLGDDGDRLLERDLAAYGGRRRGKQILGPHILNAKTTGHQPQRPLPQPTGEIGLRHQRIQGCPLDMALVTGEIERIELARTAALTRELQAPAIEGVEDGGHRLLLPFPAGADGIERLPAQGSHRAREQVARLGQPHLAAVDHQPDLAHQIVVEVAPGVQTVGAKAYHQLLRRHRQALILQKALVAQPVRLLPEQGILHQSGELHLRQRQHQVFHRCQGLEQVGVEGTGAGGQLLGEHIPGILAAPAGRQNGDVPADIADVPGAQAHLPQEILQGIGLPFHQLQGADKGGQLVKAGAGLRHVRLKLGAVEGGIDVSVVPLLGVRCLLHKEDAIKIRRARPAKQEGGAGAARET